MKSFALILMTSGALFMSISARATVLGLSFGGSISAEKNLKHIDSRGVQFVCGNTNGCFATVSLDGSSSTNLDGNNCPDCVLKNTDPTSSHNGEVRASVHADGNASVSASFSGQTETVTSSA